MRRKKPGKLLSISVRGKPKLELVRHALDRMAQRGVTQGQVVNAIKNPDETGLPTQPGRERVRKHLSSGGSVDVVYEEMDDRVRVITVTARR